MRARTAANGMLAALAALALAACQEPDVGQPCDLDVAAIDYRVGEGVACSADDADYFRSGASECDNLICIRSATGATCTGTGVPPGYPDDIRKYCSKPCVSDKDCFTSKTGLVCRAIVLSSGYLTYLQQCAANPARIDPVYGPCPPPANLAAMLALLGSLPSSNYCATPPHP